MSCVNYLQLIILGRFILDAFREVGMSEYPQLQWQNSQVGVNPASNRGFGSRH
ncbi:MAG TPA: hypothetical protein VF074_00180 [Pyrinomonadaceae bacterium]